jgi:hypothetical protein
MNRKEKILNELDRKRCDGYEIKCSFNNLEELVKYASQNLDKWRLVSVDGNVCVEELDISAERVKCLYLQHEEDIVSYRDYFNTDFEYFCIWGK